MAKNNVSAEDQIKEHTRKRIKPLELAVLLLPLAVMAASLFMNQTLPNALECETQYYPAFLRICMAAYTVFLLAACFVRGVRTRMLHLSWYFAMLFFLIGCYDYATLKTGALDSILTVTPEAIVSSVPENFSQVVTATFASVLLLLEGIAWGVVSGTASGIIMGWSYFGNYWVSPILKVIGPVPSAVWLPIAMTIMPSSHAASVFIISLAVWFPLTLNTGSAIRNTDRKYIEAARCLGASNVSVLLKVAIPSALPSFFTGMFMGLSASFGALVFAEMLGVESGLGWYIMAAKQLFSFGRVLSSVIIFIAIFSTLIWLLFKVRDAVLKWQKGFINW